MPFVGLLDVSVAGTERCNSDRSPRSRDTRLTCSRHRHMPMDTPFMTVVSPWEAATRGVSAGKKALDGFEALAYTC